MIHGRTLVPRQATFAPSRRPARSPTALKAWEVPPLAAPAESPSTSSTRTSGRHSPRGGTPRARTGRRSLKGKRCLPGH
ncbi:hypothetical protein SNL152K_9192 [Streptomyces sp. NL15-2K]|nr:hypothetical protein SNL152K_9192 [Streptomyces sp. NL15-2K]